MAATTQWLEQTCQMKPINRVGADASRSHSSSELLIASVYTLTQPPGEAGRAGVAPPPPTQ